MIEFVPTDTRVEAEVAQQRHPLLFASISGAHLYEFPPPDSDYHVRGMHLMPAREVAGLHTGSDKIEVSKVVLGSLTLTARVFATICHLADAPFSLRGA